MKITTTTGFLMAGLLSAITLPTHQAIAQTASNVACSGCVHAADIANDAVTAAKIRDSAVGPVQLGASAKPAGGDFSEPVDLNPLPSAATVVTSVTLNLPSPGVVIVNSGGYATFNDNPSSVFCIITKDTGLGAGPFVIAQNHNETNARRMPIATTRGFHETTAGIKTYNLVCTSNIGSSSLDDVLLTAFFGPRRY